MAPGHEAWFKTARYLATCYFCQETIERAAIAADKNRMFLPLTPLPRAFFSNNSSVIKKARALFPALSSNVSVYPTDYACKGRNLNIIISIPNLCTSFA